MFNSKWMSARLAALPLLGSLVAMNAGSDAVADGMHEASAKDTIVISGTVRNATSGLGIASVEVRATLASIAPALALTNANGEYRLRIASGAMGKTVHLQFSKAGFAPFTRDAHISDASTRIDASLSATSAIVAEKDRLQAAPGSVRSDNAVVAAPPPPPTSRMHEMRAAPPLPSLMMFSPAPRLGVHSRGRAISQPSRADATRDRSNGAPPDWNREQYDRIDDNPFLGVTSNPRSTFSIDVDRASYGNVRRFLTAGNAPPADAVRIEEMVNYFPYSLAQPKGDDPIAITTEVAAAPWQPMHKLVRIALQARSIQADALPPSNLVFLIDVSGSMDEPDKLPLVQESLRLLVSQLRAQDHVALVVYAGNAGLVLPSTPGTQKARIAEAIDRLEAGGSTAGGAGLELAYRIARENFLPNGNNRVILATDGDFNVGPSSDAAMERLIESKRGEGTYLTVLGFGTGNIQDAKMKKLANKGNGNYAYVDNIAEARKTLVHEMGGTLVTVANDVKLQIEFNPATVSAYRLIGYEDRLLRDEDFTDDKKDAGDMGAGHSVTALYEVVPFGVRETVKVRGTDSLRYGAKEAPVPMGPSNELLYVKLRYKKPGESSSRLMSQVVPARAHDVATSDDFRFAASVASFGMLLRNSEYKGNATGHSVLQTARGALGSDAGGYRAEFVGLVEKWNGVARERHTVLPR